MTKQITREEIEQNMILFCRSGSHAYGLNTENSDTDYKGVTIEPKRYVFGTVKFEQKNSGWNNEKGSLKYLEEPSCDAVVYALRRFLALVQDQNPNILEMLWQDDTDYLLLTDAGRKLINNRQQLLSKSISKTFTGYARAQIKKMEAHIKWLSLSKPPEKPVFENYHAGKFPFPLSYDHAQRFLEFLFTLIRERIGYFEEAVELYYLLKSIDFKACLKQYPLPQDELSVDMIKEMTHVNDDFVSLLYATQQYHKDLKHYEAYNQWKKNRNPVRGALEAKCGYDGKNASHCLRLLFMGLEGLEKHTITVNRKKAGDADFLLNVKQGKVPYEEVSQLCDEYFNRVQAAYETSTLQRKVPSHLVDELSVELMEDAYRDNYLL